MDGRTVAIMSAGAMGSAIGNVLRKGGYRVITSLEGRSGRTAALAAEAGIEAVTARYRRRRIVARRAT